MNDATGGGRSSAKVICWYGRATGNWWAVACDGAGRWRLVEAASQAGLGRRLTEIGAPQVAAAIVLDEEEGLRRVRVTYRDAGPYAVGWDGTAYEWRSGPASGLPLPADPERAADSIAAALGALTHDP